MKNNFLRKGVVYFLAAVLLVSISVGATIAYFTDTETVTNTFTVGKVEISLDEADVTTDGEVIAGANRVTENEYHLIPGRTYTKDPTIHVANDSEDCWLFVKVDNGIAAIEGATTIATQMGTNGWKNVEGNYYAYKEVVNAGENILVFGTFTIDGAKTVNVADGETVPTGKYDIKTYAGANITVTAYAIQATGFDTADAAWTALKTEKDL